MTIERWDKYFFDVCNTVASNSKCLSRNIGAILVNDKSIISTGYNSPPRGIPPCSERAVVDALLAELLHKSKKTVEEYQQLKQCPRKVLGFKSGEGLEWCVAGHAERNVLINAARNGICTKGTVMYMNCGIPCKDCLIEIINAGVSEIVVTKFMFYDNSSKYLLDNGELKCRTFTCKTEVDLKEY